MASRHQLAGAASVARFPRRIVQSGRCAASYPAGGSGVSHAAPLPFVPGPIARGIAQNGVSIDDGPDWAWTASAVPACETAKPNAFAATMNVARKRTWQLMCVIDWKRSVWGKCVSVRVDLGCISNIKKKIKKK